MDEITPRCFILKKKRQKKITKLKSNEGQEFGLVVPSLSDTSTPLSECLCPSFHHICDFSFLLSVPCKARDGSGIWFPSTQVGDQGSVQGYGFWPDSAMAAVSFWEIISSCLFLSLRQIKQWAKNMENDIWFRWRRNTKKKGNADDCFSNFICICSNTT